RGIAGRRDSRTVLCSRRARPATLPHREVVPESHSFACVLALAPAITARRNADLDIQTANSLVQATQESAAAQVTLVKYHGLLVEMLALKDLPKTEDELVALDHEGDPAGDGRGTGPAGREPGGLHWGLRVRPLRYQPRPTQANPLRLELAVRRRLCLP